MNSTFSGLPGGIARVPGITARGALKCVMAGPWNKWRDPRLRGEAAVCAAKAGRHALEREHAVIGSLTKETRPFLFFARCSPRPASHVRGPRKVGSALLERLGMQGDRLVSSNAAERMVPNDGFSNVAGR